MIVFRAATALLLGLLPVPAATQQSAAGAATAAALLAWCEANPQARMCESSWREGSDPCGTRAGYGWEGVTCDASGAVTRL